MPELSGSHAKPLTSFAPSVKRLRVTSPSRDNVDLLFRRSRRLIGDPLSVGRPARVHVETAGRGRTSPTTLTLETSRGAVTSSICPLGQPKICEPTVARPDIPGAHAAGHGLWPGRGAPG